MDEQSTEVKVSVEVDDGSSARKKLKMIAWMRRSIAVITRPHAKRKRATWRKFKQVITALERDLETPDNVVAAFSEVLTTAIQGKTAKGRKMALQRCRDALDMAEAEARSEPYEWPAYADEEVNGEKGQCEDVPVAAPPSQGADQETRTGQETPGLAPDENT